MAAITTYADLIDHINNSERSAVFMAAFSNGSVTTVCANSAWPRLQHSNNTAQAPGAAVAPDYSHIAALARFPRLPGTLTAQLWWVDAEFTMGMNTSNGVKGAAILYDRLSHQSGLDATITTAQTTNLPTAALTRYTNGEGVFPCLEIYSAIGATSTTVTASYTNQAGTAGRTTQPLAHIGSTTSGADVCLPFSLQDGDTGCRSVESVTFAGSTGTVGNVGISLVKRLGILPPDTGSMVERQGYRNMLFGGGIVEINPAACLMLQFYNSSSATSSLYLQGRLGLAEK